MRRWLSCRCPRDGIRLRQPREDRTTPCTAPRRWDQPQTRARRTGGLLETRPRSCGKWQDRCHPATKQKRRNRQFVLSAYRRDPGSRGFFTRVAQNPAMFGPQEPAADTIVAPPPPSAADSSTEWCRSNVVSFACMTFHLARRPASGPHLLAQGSQSTTQSRPRSFPPRGREPPGARKKHEEAARFRSQIAFIQVGRKRRDAGGVFGGEGGIRTASSC